MMDPEKNVTIGIRSSFDSSLEFAAWEVSSMEQTTEDHDDHATKQMQRNFKASHAQMIGLAGCIGTGVFISTGEVKSPYQCLEASMASLVGCANWWYLWSTYRIPSDLFHGPIYAHIFQNRPASSDHPLFHRPRKPIR
jgi:hypothetical protein